MGPQKQRPPCGGPQSGVGLAEQNYPENLKILISGPYIQRF